jgi:cytoskeletal protein RodZ
MYRIITKGVDNMNDRERHKRFKYVYKSLALLVAFLVGIVACTSYYVSNNGEEKPQETSQEVSKPQKVNTSEEAPEATTEETEKPESKDFTIGSGKYIVGDDVTAGKYNVSTTNESGNLIVNGDETYVNEVLGTDQTFANNNIRVVLMKGDVIEIHGLQEVNFKVVE